MKKKIIGCFSKPKTLEDNDPESPSTSNAGDGSGSGGRRKSTFKQFQRGEKPPSSSNKGGASSSSAVEIFKYKELEDATQEFDSTNCRGEGGFGKVYKGKLSDDRQVAIKKLHDLTQEYERQFNAELSILRRAKHPNIVTLIGYCAEDDQRLLVYQFMPLGSLDDHLMEGPKRDALDWNARMKIAAKAAMGLQYVHRGMKPPVLYGDVKCENILLGRGYTTKLSDFGFSKQGKYYTHDENSNARGTAGYFDPEYAATWVLKPESDIYSFGVVLLALFTGRSPMLRRSMTLADWAKALFRDKSLISQIADPVLKGRYPERKMHQVLSIAISCLQPEVKARPTPATLVESLTFLRMEENDVAGRPQHRRIFSLPPGIFSTDRINNLNPALSVDFNIGRWGTSD